MTNCTASFSTKKLYLVAASLKTSQTKNKEFAGSPWLENPLLSRRLQVLPSRKKAPRPTSFPSSSREASRSCPDPLNLIKVDSIPLPPTPELAQRLGAAYVDFDSNALAELARLATAEYNEAQWTTEVYPVWHGKI
jgi:hypothetical protein